MNSAWASPYAPPRYFQKDRGMCWAFSTLGILEESYRQNGVEKGFLKPNQYVRFSEQAYGKAMVEQCAKHPEACNDLGDFVVDGSTEGGEIYWLYLFPELYSQLLPNAVCPYIETEDPKTDVECPEYDKAVKTNPIKFKINAMTQKYSGAETREFLMKEKRSMAWSCLIHDAFFYFPCTDAYWASSALCSPERRKRCPTDKFYNSEYCAVFTSPMYNPDGEFFAHGNMYPAGGHGMNVVGFNDNFVTKTGSKGGFIIKNSWEDKTYYDARTSRGVRGSHSIQYWMQQISDWDERKICPNPSNPNNWISCALQDVGPTMRHGVQGKHVHTRRAPRDRTGAIKADEIDISATCLNSTYLNNLVDWYYQPSEFRCVDEQYCSKDPKYRYFLLEAERSVDGWMLKVSMLQYNTATKRQTTVELPYLYDGLIPYIFAPIDSQAERLADSDDLCGFYFWPYDLLDRQVGLFGGFSATHFEIEWDDASYLANSAKCPSCDYTYLRQSMTEQDTFTPMTQNPWNTQRYDVDA